MPQKTRKIQYRIEKRAKGKHAIIPQLLLQGKQLENAGFTAGAEATVTITKGKILITI